MRLGQTSGPGFSENSYFASPPQAAAYSLNVDVIKLLLERGADVNAQGPPYGSPLWAVGAAIKDYRCTPENIEQKTV